MSRHIFGMDTSMFSHLRVSLPIYNVTCLHGIGTYHKCWYLIILAGILLVR